MAQLLADLTDRLVAGASGLRYRSLAPWSLAATSLWALTFTLVGYAFAASFESATGVIGAAMAAIAAVIAAAWIAHAHRQASRLRAKVVRTPC